MKDYNLLIKEDRRYLVKIKRHESADDYYVQYHEGALWIASEPYLEILVEQLNSFPDHLIAFGSRTSILNSLDIKMQNDIPY